MFQNLKGNGRVWIHAANRALTPSEVSTIKSKFTQFCASWDAHGNSLLAEFEIAHNQILILAVDEDHESASGCSIDKATEVFRAIDEKFQLDLFNRMNLTFLSNDEIRIVQMMDINQAYHSNIIKDSTTFLDNTVSLLVDFKSRWEVPFSQSWAFRKVKKLAQTS
ncbi:MAG: ABC transporter ATPase [Bacteroidia bacterium]|nr:ABC transporter ATPase [Bacteroidia bacterium]NNJ55451.1 ABC transporter ATPase [Bacteroidia bacterium]